MYYVIDGAIPVFSFDNFTTESRICGISNYSLHEEYEGTEVLSQVDSSWIINLDGRVQFQLHQEEVALLHYYLRVEADGGEVLWVNENKTLESYCTVSSAGEIRQRDGSSPLLEQMPYDHSYSTNTSLTFDEFESDSTVCVVERYELLQAQEG